MSADEWWIPIAIALVGAAAVIGIVILCEEHDVRVCVESGIRAFPDKTRAEIEWVCGPGKDHHEAFPVVVPVIR